MARAIHEKASRPTSSAQTPADEMIIVMTEGNADDGARPPSTRARILRFLARDRSTRYTGGQARAPTAWCTRWGRGRVQNSL